MDRICLLAVLGSCLSCGNALAVPSSSGDRVRCDLQLGFVAGSNAMIEVGGLGPTQGASTLAKGGLRFQMTERWAFSGWAGYGLSRVDFEALNSAGREQVTEIEGGGILDREIWSGSGMSTYAGLGWSQRNSRAKLSGSSPTMVAKSREQSVLLRLDTSFALSGGWHCNAWLGSYLVSGDGDEPFTGAHYSWFHGTPRYGIELSAPLWRRHSRTEPEALSRPAAPDSSEDEPGR